MEKPTSISISNQVSEFDIGKGVPAPFSINPMLLNFPQPKITQGQWAALIVTCLISSCQQAVFNEV
jgi:hypothetical protein